jgi:hypothetical protein
MLAPLLLLLLLLLPLQLLREAAGGCVCVLGHCVNVGASARQVEGLKRVCVILTI